MSRIAICIASLALIVATGAGAPVPKELKNNDAAGILGDWKTVRADRNNAEYNSSRDYLIFTEGKVNWKTVAGGMDYIWTLTLDQTKTPKEFEIEMGNIKYLGIYKLEGDELTLACRTGTRPTEFSSADNTYLHKMTRVK